MAKVGTNEAAMAMRRALSMIAALGLAWGTTACDREGKSSDAPAPAAKAPVAAPPIPSSVAAPPDPAAPSEADLPAEPPALPAGQKVIELSPQGPRAPVPEATVVVPAAVEGAWLVRGPDLFVIVMPAAADRPRTPEDAAAAVRSGSAEVHPEMLDDGWVITFETRNALGPVRFVQARRELGGTSYWCESVVPEAAQQAQAVALCRGLRP